jgi:hypothetical protein
VSTQSQLNLEQARLDVLKYANETPSISTTQMATQDPAATKAIQ